MQKHLKILHTISLHRFRGPAEAVVRLAEAQIRSGHEVSVALDTYQDGDLLERVRDSGVQVDERFVLSNGAGSILHMRDVLTFKKIWTESSVDIIHCHRSHDHTLAAIARPASTRARLVRSIFNDRALDAKHAWQLRRADGMVVMNEDALKSLLNRGLMDQWRIFLVSRAIDPNVFRPGKGAKMVLDDAGIESGSVVAGLIFTDEDIDKVVAFLDVWKDVNQTVSSAALLMVHVRPNNGKDALVDERIEGMKSVVCMHAEKYEPQIHRAFGLEIILPLGGQGQDARRRLALEAMATSVPIVTMKNSPAAQLLWHGGGRVLDPGDMDALKETLVELLSNEKKLHEAGSDARHEATRENAMDHQEGLLEKFYSELLSDGMH